MITNGSQCLSLPRFESCSGQSSVGKFVIWLVEGQWFSSDTQVFSNIPELTTLIKWKNLDWNVSHHSFNLPPNKSEWLQWFALIGLKYVMNKFCLDIYHIFFLFFSVIPVYGYFCKKKCCISRFFGINFRVLYEYYYLFTIFSHRRSMLLNIHTQWVSLLIQH